MIHQINIHSMVDVITNSSTVIYTYQNSTSEAKALIQEILNLIGNYEKVDDLFYIGSFCDLDIYYNHLENDEDELPDDYSSDDETYVERVFEKVLKGEIKKPDWMERAEGSENYSRYNPSSYLTILAKDAKYENLAKKIITFLNSSKHDGGFEG